MRWPLILGVAGSTAVGLSTGCGGYCPGFSWSQRSPAWVDLEIPVDATPWLVRPCDHRNAPFDCALVVGDATIPVKTRTTGACDGSESVGFTQTAIQTLRPEAPLPPGATLILDCDHPDVDEYDWEYYTYDNYSPPETPFTLRVRASPVPAAPPGALDHLELQYTRDDPNLSCTGGDYIEVRIDFDAIFLRQGGYVEVVYPNGQVLEFSRKNLAGAAALPPSRGLLKFTPVAIDGERGETVIVDASQIPEELVYLPGCGIHRAAGERAARPDRRAGAGPTTARPRAVTQSGSIAMLLWTWLLEPVDQPVAGLPPWTPIEPPAPEPAPAAGAPASLPTPAAREAMPAETAPPRRRRFVFAWMTGLTFGVSRWLIPSFSGAAFFGGRLRRERWALGVMVTGTFGMADRYWLGLLGVRLHFAAVHRFRAFGFASIGAGVASFLWYPAVAEIETRVGTALGPRKRLLLGGQVRLGVDFFYREKVPLPQFGIFTGMCFL